MDQSDPPRVIGQVKGFLDRRVAAADDDHVLVAEKEPVAGGAGRDAEPAEGVLARHAEPACLRARGKDHRLAEIEIARIAGRDERSAPEVERGDHVQDHPGADMLGLGVHLLHQPGALDDLREPRIVLDIGRDRQLPARLQPGDQNRLQIGARGVDRCGIACRPRADNQHFAVMVLRHPANPVVWTAHYTIFPLFGDRCAARIAAPSGVRSPTLCGARSRILTMHYNKQQ